MWMVAASWPLGAVAEKSRLVPLHAPAAMVAGRIECVRAGGVDDVQLIAVEVVDLEMIAGVAARLTRLHEHAAGRGVGIRLDAADDEGGGGGGTARRERALHVARRRGGFLRQGQRIGQPAHVERGGIHSAHQRAADVLQSHRGERAGVGALHSGLRLAGAVLDLLRGLDAGGAAAGGGQNDSEDTAHE